MLLFNVVSTDETAQMNRKVGVNERSADERALFRVLQT